MGAKLNVKKYKTEILEWLICEAESELRNRQIMECPDPLAEMRGMQEVKRALTVAAAGKHPVYFVGPAQSGKSHFVSAAAKLGLRAFEARTCACGYHLHPLTQCRCYESSINTYWTQRKNMEPIYHVEMLVLVTPVATLADMESAPVGTTMHDIERQLADLSPRPPFDDAAPGTKSVLERFAHELRLPPNVIRSLKKISETIASLANAPGVEAEHVVEAVSYRPSLDRILK